MTRKAIFAGAFITVAISTFVSHFTAAAPRPAGQPSLRLKLAGEMKLPDLAIENAAIIGEEKVVVVGTTGNDDGEKEGDTLDANGAILDLGKKVHRPFTNGHKARIGTVSVSGDRIVTASNERDPVLRIWDFKAEKAVAAIKIEDPRTERVRYGAVCFRRGNRVAIAAQDRVIVLDPAKPNERTEFGTPDDKAYYTYTHENLTISPDDAWIACAVGTGHVAFWEVATKKTIALSLVPEKTEADDNWMSSGVTFGRKGSILAWRWKPVGGEVPNKTLEKDAPPGRRGVVRVDLDNKKVIPLNMGQSIYTLACAIDPTGDWLATAGSSRRDKPRADGNYILGEVRIYHLPTGALVFREPVEGLPLNWVGFTPSGKRLVSATYDGVVRWWDVQKD